MSDLFQDDVPVEFIQRVFSVMNRASWHRYQVLTKRSERLAQLSDQLLWSPNIWMGVSVENQKYAYRIDHLKKTGAAIKFLSLEPLLGPLPNLRLSGIDWVIVGGESGPELGQCLNPGARYPGTMPSVWHRILFQAVGRSKEERNRPHFTRTHLG